MVGPLKELISLGADTNCIVKFNGAETLELDHPLLIVAIEGELKYSLE